MRESFQDGDNLVNSSTNDHKCVKLLSSVMISMSFWHIEQASTIQKCRKYGQFRVFLENSVGDYSQHDSVFLEFLLNSLSESAQHSEKVLSEEQHCGRTFSTLVWSFQIAFASAGESLFNIVAGSSQRAFTSAWESLLNTGVVFSKSLGISMGEPLQHSCRVFSEILLNGVAES